MAKSRMSRGLGSYADIQRNLENHIRTREGKKMRGHSLSQEKLDEVLERWREGRRFVSPYTSSIRTDHLMALVKLGVNKAWHLGLEVKPVLKKIMLATPDKNFKSRWHRFEGNERGKMPSDVTERIYDNYRSFRRLCADEFGNVGVDGFNPYGLKLWQIGCCVDIFKVHEMNTDDEIISTERYIRLNTYSRVPVVEVVRSREEIPPVRGVTLGPQ